MTCRHCEERRRALAASVRRGWAYLRERNHPNPEPTDRVSEAPTVGSDELLRQLRQAHTERIVKR
jgi:hypothetical protein